MANQRKGSISRELKDQILERVKQGEAPITQIAQEHGISPKTIYSWLAKGATNPPSWAEVNRLKREKKVLLELIGKLTYQMSTSQKGG